MTIITPIAAIGGSIPQLATNPIGPTSSANMASFTDLITRGIQSVDTKIAKADALIQAYAMGDSVPVHQVTLAIEQARMAVDMAVQIRAKLVDTYHDFLNMQL